MDRYIGLDVHASSCTAGIIDTHGKRVRQQVLETNGEALVEFVRAQPGAVHLCIEEGTQSAWLYEILRPHVAELVVTRSEHSAGPKDDARDAFALAERLRTNAVATPVYKELGRFAPLRALVKAHRMVVGDTTRVQCRLKALFRARGVAVAGKEVYRPRERATWLAALPASARAAAELLYTEYDGLCTVRAQAEKALLAESHRHPCTRLLETCPGLGGIRVAQLVAVVVTPTRFRTRQQFWSYCGLGIVMRSSADWAQDPAGQWVRTAVQRTRGLNRRHNALLKSVFKGAATTVVGQVREGPLYGDYQRLLTAGTKPNLAKLTVARKIAAIALTMWKRQEVYNPVANCPPPV